VTPWEKIFNRYEIVKRELKKTGTKVYNATVGGELETFERMKLEEVVK